MNRPLSLIHIWDDSFLVGPTERTTKLWDKVMKLYEEEREKGGMLDADTSVATHITAHAPGYIDKDLETIVGLQTDKPLKRAMFPYGGLRTAKSAIEEYGFKMDPQTEDFFKKHRKTHNDGVFDVYTPEMRAAVSYTHLDVYKRQDLPSIRAGN